MEYNYDVLIPKDRIAVLVGEKGKVKNLIQKKLDIKIRINSETGEVNLTGEDSLYLIIAQNMVKAIGRGFNPDIALDLLNDEINFELIDITEYSKTKNNIDRLRARVIGTGGKARKYIETLTNTKIVIYGKTIGIIGDHEGVSLARRGFEGLLSGQRHSTVYSFLEKQRKKNSALLY